jgi:regulator of sigma E protease
MSILKITFIIIEVLLVFNLLIFVHELGHFLAARWRGLRIDRFAIWFGKPIWKRRIGGVEYALGWIPAGGYVALPQMATMEAIEGKADHSDEPPLPNISPMDKIIVAFAGPLFSFLLAVGFAAVVWMVGKPVSEAERSTTIGWVDPEGPAYKAGLRAGDRIVEVDGFEVTQFAGASQDSLTWRIITSQGTNIAIKYVRNGQEQMAYPVPYRRETKWYERKALRQILVAPAHKAVVYEVAENSPAALAGLTQGDEIVALDGRSLYGFMAVLDAQDAMAEDGIKPVTLTVKRGNETFERVVTPEEPVSPADSGPSLGIVSWMGNTDVKLIHPSPWDQIKDSAGQIFATLGALTSSKTDIGVQQLGGAVMIIRVYKNLFESENGWRMVLWFSVVLNVNLALLNLLPFPVLDGGHITLALVEGIRRRPVHAKFLQFVQNACAMLLIGFMLFIAFFDTGDWVRSARADREEPLVFSDKPADHNP